MIPRPPTSTLFPYTTLFRSIHVPGHTTPIPVEVPLAEARTLHTMLGDVLAEHEPPADERAAHEPTEPSIVCRDRKSTRLNSSHVEISYAVFCLKKKKTTQLS